MAYIKDVKIGNNTYLIEPILYAATGGTADAITLALSNFELVTGAQVTAKITTTNNAAATLSVNSTTAGTIKYNDANIAAGALKAKRVYSFVYDGTNWQLIGELDTNTWRGIQNTLTSDSTTDSLSAAQGKVLDSTKVSKSGDRMTGDLIIGETSSDGTVISSGSFKIGAKNDNYGVMPFANNWNSLGASNLQWYRSYVVNYYGANSHIANWDSNNNIGTAASSSAASVKGLVNFYNECAAGGTQTKTALQASATSNITLTLPNATGTLALTSSTITGNAANVNGTVAIEHGGTGATTASGARTNLGLGSIAVKADTDYVLYGGDDTNLGSGSPASTAKTYWADNTKIPDNMLKTYYNHSGTEYTLFFSKRATYGSILKWGYGDTYLRILRIQSGTWKSDDWEKISAGYADSAGSVALSGVTGADDLKAIEALSGTSGFLKKTAANTWALDTNTYALSSHNHNDNYPLKTSTTIAPGKATKLKFSNGFQCTIGAHTSNSGARAFYKASGYGVSTIRITIFELAESPQVKYYIPDDEESIIFCNQSSSNTQTLWIVMDAGSLPTITTDLTIPDNPSYLNHHILTELNYTDYTVKKDGTGASGNWGINITGTATTATNLAAKPSFATSSSTQITLTAGGKTSDAYTVPYATSTTKLNQTATTALSSFTDSTSFIYTAAGGSNTVTDKPTNVDAFGCLSFKTADGWYGQLLMSSNTASGIYWRTATSLSGGWKKLLDSNNTYAANSNGTAVSVARNTDTTIATINGVAVKIKIPASDNTWRPIGTGATDAAAGNHTHNYVPYASGNNDLNTIYDTGIYNITSGSMTNGPTTYGFGEVITFAYRKHSGNTTPDYATQIYAHYNTNTTDNTLYFRTSSSSAWNTWQMVAHANAGTAVGSSTTPVYVNAKGALQSCTAYSNATVAAANYPTGFVSYSASAGWGNTTGTCVTSWNGGDGCEMAFFKNNPASGQLSMKIDGTIYIKEGGQNIAEAVKSFSVSGQTITYTTLWGGTGTFTTQDTDTKNTAGSTNSASKLFLIGATSQNANPTTNSYQYTYTTNGLLSSTQLGLNASGNEKVHMEWNSTDLSIDFIFN